METKRARLMPERRSLRFIEGAGAVQHQNGATAAVMVQGLHTIVANVGGAVSVWRPMGWGITSTSLLLPAHVYVAC